MRRGVLLPAGLLVAALGVVAHTAWRQGDTPERSRRAAPAAPVPAAPPRHRAPPPAATLTAAAAPTAPAHADEAPPEAAVGEVQVALHVVRSAKADPSEDGTSLLVDSLASGDPVVVAEAADGLIARRAASALPALTSMDVHHPAGAAPSIIHAIGRLGGVADRTDGAAAVRRLVVLLGEEKQRSGPDSPGNILQIYEALGDTRHPDAAGPLEAELLDPRLADAPKVVVAQALVRVGARSSRAVITRAREVASAAAHADAFEEEIRQDLLDALDSALAALP